MLVSQSLKGMGNSQSWAAGNRKPPCQCQPRAISLICQRKHSHTLLIASGVRMTKLLAPLHLGLGQEGQGIQPACPPWQLQARRKQRMLQIVSHCFEVFRGQNKTKDFFNY